VSRLLSNKACRQTDTQTHTGGIAQSHPLPPR